MTSPRTNASQSRKINRLKDAVYREMFLLEANRPGAEMGLALALLRAWMQTEAFDAVDETRNWLKDICPIGVRMIENSLHSECPERRKRPNHSSGS
jgi:hypothetical protein